MGLVNRFEVRALFVVGLALLFCGAKGARRGLVDNAATVFDVTKYGAVADGETECAQVGLEATYISHDFQSSFLFPTFFFFVLS